MSLHALIQLLNPARSVRARLLWMVAVTGLVIALLLSYFVGDQSTRQLRNDRGVLVAEIASQMATELDKGVYERYREIMIFSKLDVIRDPQTPLDAKRALLEKLQSSYRDYAWLGITDAQGTIVVGTGRLLEGVSVAERDWFIKGSKGPHAGDVHDAFLLSQLLSRTETDPLPLRLVDISMPIRDDAGNLLGVICGHLSWAWADRVRSSLLKPLINRRSLEVLVLNREGRILLGTVTLPEQPEPLRLHSVSMAQRGGNGYEVERWSDGSPYLVGYARGDGHDYYPGLGWLVLVREEMASAFGAANQVARNTLLISLGFAALFVVLLWPVINRSLGTMLSITRAADGIRNGERGARIPQVEGEDEAAALSASLRNLVTTLEDQKSELRILNSKLREEMELQRQSAEELRLAAQVFDSSTEGIIITDKEQHILKVNRAFCDITGYSPEEIIGQTPKILRSGRHDRDFYRAMWHDLNSRGNWQGEIWNRRKSGEVFPELLVINVVHGDSGAVSHYVAIFIDISERKMAEDHILHLAHHDALTELPNRLLFIDRLRQSFVQAKLEQHKVALLSMDIDRFKTINDTLGHHIGDQLLQEVARRLHHTLQGINTIARLGGDEFVILLNRIGAIEDAGHMASRIINAMAQPFTITEHTLTITVSIGIGIYPDDGADVITLMKSADVAMYHAKEMGRNNYQYFTAEMNARIEEQLVLETHLRRALEHNELSLHYQPQVDLHSGRILGVETLLRWNSAELGAISPARFIPVAEESGLIIPISKWMLRTACQQLRRWEEGGINGIRVAVNLSALQFRQADFVETLEQLVAEMAIAPAQLELELTESTLMESAGHTIENLNHLRQRGFPIAIDDFGTGYSSLSYLKRFPVDRLKIDQSFVHDVDTDSDDAAIVSAIIAMARNLNLKVLAEGVEKAEHRAFLLGLRCDEAQGYLYSQPMAAREVEAILRAGVIELQPA
ncbi:MAG TPA: EAL domain-containing protein [Gammaproteobacteria bacterium]